MSKKVTVGTSVFTVPTAGGTAWGTNFNAWVDGVSSTVTAVSGNFSAISGSISAVSSAFGPLSSSYLSLSASFLSLSGNVAGLSGTFDATRQSYLSLSASFLSLSGNLRSVSGTVANLSSSWSSIPTSASYLGSWGASDAGDGGIKCLKDPWGVVHLMGGAKYGSGLGTTIGPVFGLPVGFRPPVSRYFAVYASDTNNVQGPAILVIDASGTGSWTDQAITDAAILTNFLYIFTDGITFLAAGSHGQ